MSTAKWQNIAGSKKIYTWGVTIGNKGRVIVAECKVMRVIIFNQAGNFLNKFCCYQKFGVPQSSSNWFPVEKLNQGWPHEESSIVASSIIHHWCLQLTIRNAIRSQGSKRFRSTIFQSLEFRQAIFSIRECKFFAYQSPGYSIFRSTFLLGVRSRPLNSPCFWQCNGNPLNFFFVLETWIFENLCSKLFTSRFHEFWRCCYFSAQFLNKNDRNW